MTLPPRTLFFATIIGIAHVVCGIAVMYAPAALFATPLAFMHQLVAIIWSPEAVVTGPTLIAVGLAAIIGGSASMDGRWQLLLIAPQQLILGFQIISISIALATGMYPDGYRPHGGAWFIVADQVWAWIFALVHTFEVFGLWMRGR